MSNPDARTRAWDFVLATIIAATLFSSLAFAIKVKPYKTVTESTAPNAGIFSLASSPDDCAPRHRELVKWLEYKDPSSVTLPPEEGFNRDHPSRNWIYRDSEFFSKKNSLPPLATTLVEQPPYVFEQRLPVEPPQNPKEELSLQSLTRISFPVYPAPAPKPQAGVYWLDEQSRTITDLPPLDITTIKAVDRVATGPTYILLTPMENTAYQPRVTVEMGCGDRELDLIATRHLARWLRRLTVQKSNPLRESWLMTPRRIAVVWRYVPGITYSPPNGTLDEPVDNEPDAG